MKALKDGLGKIMCDTAVQLGFCAYSILSVEPRSISELKKRLKESYVSSSADLRDWPGYMLRTAGKRADPLVLCPWARSFAIFAFPFKKIPLNKNFLPETADDSVSGLVAGYAGRIDYHIFLREKIIRFAESMKKNLGKDFRDEVFVDTKPVAEKSLAAFSGLGCIGLNSCLLCKGQGSGTCLGILALDIELPATEHADYAAPCSTCVRCVERCPTGAITGKPGEFIYRKCRSYITMEKKGELEKNESAFLGDWIFGCDICTSLCPGSSLPSPIRTNLEWLLLEKDSVVNNIIKGTPLEYPSLKLLRRNALAVLKNKKSSRAGELAEKFIRLNPS